MPADPGHPAPPRSTLRAGDHHHPRGGIVRAPRRPAGWLAPGPAPAGPEGDPTLAPGPREDLCFLTGDWRIFQRVDGHRWSLDDLVTAWVAVEGARAHPPARVCDLGTGIGSVLMMLAWFFPEATGCGIEVQSLSLGMAERSVRYNGAAARLDLQIGDLRDRSVLPPGRFDLVTGTPPYFHIDQGVVSDRPQRGPCRFEMRGGVEAYFGAATKLLAEHGTFVVCEDSRQVARVEAAARASGLRVRARLDVVPREAKPPLFTVFTCDRGSPVTIPRTQTLVVRRRDGERTPEFQGVRRTMGLPA